MPKKKPAGCGDLVWVRFGRTANEDLAYIVDNADERPGMVAIQWQTRSNIEYVPRDAVRMDLNAKQENGEGGPSTRRQLRNRTRSAAPKNNHTTNDVRPPDAGDGSGDDDRNRTRSAAPTDNNTTNEAHPTDTLDGSGDDERNRTLSTAPKNNYTTNEAQPVDIGDGSGDDDVLENSKQKKENGSNDETGTKEAFPVRDKERKRNSAIHRITKPTKLHQTKPQFLDNMDDGSNDGTVKKKAFSGRQKERKRKSAKNRITKQLKLHQTKPLDRAPSHIVKEVQVVNEDDALSVLSDETCKRKIPCKIPSAVSYYVSLPKKPAKRCGFFTTRRRDFHHSHNHTLANTSAVQVGRRSGKRGRHSAVGGEGSNKRHRVSFGQNSQNSEQITAPSSTGDEFDFEGVPAVPTPREFPEAPQKDQDTRNHSQATRSTGASQNLSLQTTQSKAQPKKRVPLRRVSFLSDQRSFLKRCERNTNDRNCMASSQEPESIAPSNGKKNASDHTLGRELQAATRENEKLPSPAGSKRTFEDKAIDDGDVGLAMFDAENDVEIHEIHPSVSPLTRNGNEVLATLDSNVGRMEKPSEESSRNKEEQGKETSSGLCGAFPVQNSPAKTFTVLHDQDAHDDDNDKPQQPPSFAATSNSTFKPVEASLLDGRSNENIMTNEPAEEAEQSVDENHNVGTANLSSPAKQSSFPSQLSLGSKRTNLAIQSTRKINHESPKICSSEERPTEEGASEMESNGSLPGQTQQVLQFDTNTGRRINEVEEKLSNGPVSTPVQQIPSATLDANKGEKVSELEEKLSNGSVPAQVQPTKVQQVPTVPLDINTGKKASELEEKLSSNIFDPTSPDRVTLLPSPHPKTAAHLEKKCTPVATLPRKPDLLFCGNSPLLETSGNSGNSEPTHKLTCHCNAGDQSPKAERNPNAHCLESGPLDTNAILKGLAAQGSKKEQYAEVSKISQTSERGHGTPIHQSMRLDGGGDDVECSRSRSSSIGDNDPQSGTCEGQLSREPESREKHALRKSASEEDSSVVCVAIVKIHQKEGKNHAGGGSTCTDPCQQRQKCPSPMKGEIFGVKTSTTPDKSQEEVAGRQVTRRASTTHTQQPSPTSKPSDRRSSNDIVNDLHRNKLILDLHSDSISEKYDEGDALKSADSNQNQTSHSSFGCHDESKKTIPVEFGGKLDATEVVAEEEKHLPVPDNVCSQDQRQASFFEPSKHFSGNVETNDGTTVEILDVDDRHAVELILEEGISSSKEILQADFRTIDKVSLFADERPTESSNDINIILASMATLPFLSEVSLSLAGKSLEVKQLMMLFHPQNCLRKLQLIDVSLSGQDEDFHVQGNLLELRELHLTHCKVSNTSNHLSFETWVFEFLTCSPVTKVWLESCRISSDCIAKFGQSSQHLELGLRCMPVPINIQSFANLNKLSLIDCSEIHVREIMTTTEHSPAMKEIVLWGRIKHPAAVNFLRKLQRNQAVEKLTLSVAGGSDLSELGVELLLETNSRLRSLAIVLMGEVKNARRGSAVILEALEKNSCVESLRIHVDKGYEVVEECSRVERLLQKNSTIKLLHLLGVEWQASD